MNQKSLDRSEIWGNFFEKLWRQKYDSQEDFVSALESTKVGRIDPSILSRYKTGKRKLKELEDHLLWIEAFIQLGLINTSVVANRWLNLAGRLHLTPEELTKYFPTEATSIHLDPRHLLEGISALSFDYASRIQNFLTEYLGDSEHLIPFGGRDHDLAALDAWLDEPDTPPYLLLAAQAGRGKSTLLVRWSQKLLHREDLAVVFIPVSIRFRTNLASVVFAALAARLAFLHGDQIPGSLNTSTEIWRGLATDYMTRPLPDGRRLLVILDGVDEAADWKVGPHLFPLSPPSGLHITLSVRYLIDAPDDKAWLNHLGWQRPGLAQVRPLSPLSQTGLIDVLKRMGIPLDQLGERVDIITELHRLSEGDPLLVRLYVDGLWQRKEQTPYLQPKDLHRIQPGLHGYFELWWRDQKELWGESKPLRERTVRLLLNLLACALGPLSRNDIVDHLAPPDIPLDNWMLEDALEPLARFVIGDGLEQGYVFTHPRLGRFFYEERLTRVQQQQWDARFLDWGEKTLVDLNEGRLDPKDVSAYLLQYYGAHLERSNASPNAHLALVSDGWRQAWETLEGAYSGFLNDVDRAWQIAGKLNAAAIKAGHLAPYLGAEVFCALCQASISNLSANIPNELLLVLVAEQVWSPAQGLAYARRIPDLARRAKALIKLSSYLPMEHIEQALSELLVSMQKDSENDEWILGEILQEIIPHLPKTLLDDVLTIIRGFEIDENKLTILDQALGNLRITVLAEMQAIEEGQKNLESSIYTSRNLDARSAQDWIEDLAKFNDFNSMLRAAKFLPDHLLVEALSIAYEIDDQKTKAKILAALSPRLPNDEQETIFIEALTAVQSGEDTDGRVDRWEMNFRADIIVALAPQLPQKLVNEAFTTARTIEYIDERIRSLAALIPRLPVDKQIQIWAEELASLSTSENDWVQKRVLVEFAGHLPEEVLDQASSIARNIKDEEDRSVVLTALATHLPKKERKSILIEALSAVSAIRDEEEQLYALVGLAAYGSEKMKQEIDVAPTLVTVFLMEFESQRFSPPWFSLDKLKSLVSHFSEQVLDEVLSILRKSENERLGEDEEETIAEALKVLMPHLTGSLMSKALTTVTMFREEKIYSELIPILAPHLSADLLTKVWQIVKEMNDSEYQSDGIAGLAPYLPKKLLREALTTARKVGYYERGIPQRALAALVPHLPQKLGEEVWTEVSSNPYAIGSQWFWRKAVSEMVPYLSEEINRKVWTQVISAARTFGIAWSYPVQTIVNLAPQLPDELRLEILKDAFSKAQMMGFEGSRSNTLTTLVPHLPGELLGEVLTSAQMIKDIGFRSRVFVALSARLPKEIMEPFWSETLASIWAIELQKEQGELLGSVIRHLPERWLDTVLSKIWPIKWEYTQWNLIRSIIPHLSERWLNNVLTKARRIKDETFRAAVLASLIPYLSADVRTQVLEETRLLAVARGIKNEGLRAEVLTTLIPYLSADVRTQVLEEAWVSIELIVETLADPLTLRDEHTKSQVISNLAPYLTAELLLEALAMIQEFEDENFQFDALTALVPRLQGLMSSEGLAVVQRTENIYVKLGMLITLIPYLPEALLNAVLGEVQSIQAEDLKSSVLQFLISYWPDEMLGQLLATIKTIKIEDERAELIAVLASRLPQQLLDEALIMAKSMKEEEAQVVAMTALTPHGTMKTTEQQALCRALYGMLAERIGSRESPYEINLRRRIKTKLTKGRPDILSDLINHLSVEQRTHLLIDGLILTRWASAESKLLRSLMSCLPEKAREQAVYTAISTVQATEADWFWTKVLPSNARYLPPEMRHPLLAEALHTIPMINRHPNEQGEALVALASYLPEELFGLTLAATHTLDEYNRSQVLIALASHLPEELLGEALSTAQEIKYKSTRWEVLIALAPRLPKEKQHQILIEALSFALATVPIDDRYPPVDLTALEPYLTKLSADTLYTLLRGALLDRAGGPRYRLMADLFALAPMIALLGGTKAADETIHAIQAVNQWWP